MKTNPVATLKDIALSQPGAARVFESYHLDYCCGGNQTLAEACRSAGLVPEEVAASLDQAQSEPAAEPQWNKATLTELIRFIIDQHHAFTRSELSRIENLIAKVIARHGAAHSELGKIDQCFVELKADLGPHLLKEEQVLFPYIEALENHRQQKATLPPACFGTIDNPIRMMTIEHETVGSLLKQIRTLTANFVPPADACPTYQALYQAMEGLETDLMRHIHLENNVLFPGARELSGSA